MIFSVDAYFFPRIQNVLFKKRFDPSAPHNLLDIRVESQGYTFNIISTRL